MSTTVPPTDPWASTDHDPTAQTDSVEEHRAQLHGALTDATTRCTIDHDTA
jgi:hypothetical protein